MISVYKIKPKFQQLLKPILDAMYRMGFTANSITWMAIALSIFTGIFCWFYPGKTAMLILPMALLLRMALNALDGMMARTYNMQSKAGEVLNEIGDVISDLCIFAPIGILFKLDPIILVVFLLLSAVNEFAGILGKAVSGERRYEGPMGKSDRALVIGLIALISFFSEVLLPYTNYIFGVVLALLIISTAVRIRKTLTISA